MTILDVVGYLGGAILGWLFGTALGHWILYGKFSLKE